ncbi:hypothetical protein CYMTET_20312 [Cymbomonas tetramitiformis]|uniref:Uncharacterized protein n=1 Tax=Cymbomonas tetramitiformis TaxID=36881 RepID=A0AAE0G4B1_9CHLO|nr:hypothetical protein CYMTET_20312 [Cymbomonas tetramitiformis]
MELKETYPVDADFNAIVVLPDGVFEYADGIFDFCFPTRNILENAKRARDDVTENIKRLHKCRSREQFQHLGKLVIHRLRTKFKEEQVVTLIENEYLSVPYDCWYVTASGVVCCSPSSQPIEAYWKVVEATKLYKLRARLDNMMHEQLPNWLYLDATTGLCEPISSYNGGVVPAEIIAAAHEKLNAKAYKR